MVPEWELAPSRHCDWADKHELALPFAPSARDTWPLTIVGVLVPSTQPRVLTCSLSASFSFTPFPDILDTLTLTVCYAEFKQIALLSGPHPSSRSPECTHWMLLWGISYTGSAQSAKMLVQRVLSLKKKVGVYLFSVTIPVTSALVFLLSTVT